MAVTSFTRGLRAFLFMESLVRSVATSMSDSCARATCHIEAEEVMSCKKEEERREAGIQFQECSGKCTSTMS